VFYDRKDREEADQVVEGWVRAYGEERPEEKHIGSKFDEELAPVVGMPSAELVANHGRQGEDRTVHGQDATAAASCFVVGAGGEN
jgi:hypothetical protein